MLFNTLNFFIFFLFVFIIQRLLPHRPRNIFLLATSYFFYSCWDWRFLSLILISTLVDFYCGRAIYRSNEEKICKRYVVASIFTNLGILGFFKYAGFFVDSANTLISSLGYDPTSFHLNIVLPVGISFYTFQTMSYTIDIYRRQVKPAENIIDFALFVSFFPQLVAGPIERAKTFLPQILKKPLVPSSMIMEGGWLVFWGLFKKAVIADNMAVIVDQAFQSSKLTGGELLIAVYAFAIQIYCDFSGYSDIARGIAKTMGYNLTLNFKVPFFSTNPSEFWRRWHISLSTWLRDYLYIPLGGNRSGKLKTYRNLFATMLLGGLWHGAAWTFVLWGTYHGLLLSIHRLISRFRFTLPFIIYFKSNFPPQSSIYRFFNKAWWLMRVIMMFHLVCFGWLIFRSESFGQLACLMGTLLSGMQFTVLSFHWLWALVVFSVPLFVIQVMQEVSGDTNIILKLSLFARTMIYSGLLFVFLTMSSITSKAFVYFQF